MNRSDVLSTLAIIVASASLFVSWRAYRRGSPDVHVRAAHERSGTYAGVLIEWDVVAVHVTNRGLADVQVTAVELEVAGRDARIPADREGPRLHHLLPGLHSEKWAIRLSELADAAAIAGGDTARLRAWVTLGNDAQEHSKWLTHTVVDDQ